MGEIGQDQAITFEPAGSPETTSPEAQRNQLINTVDRTDKVLGSKVVTRIPMNTGNEVLIFNAEILHDAISHLGISPTEGPILVTHGQLSNDLQKLKNVTPPEVINTTWEKLVDISDLRGITEVTGGKRGKSEVRTIQPKEQEIWDRALRESVSLAKHQIETEQKLAQVLPQSLTTAMRIAEGVNILPEQRIPPEYAVDEPRRTDVGGQEEHPADLRPAPPQDSEPQV